MRYAGELVLVEIRRVWILLGLAFWRKTKWTPAGEKFHIFCALETETLVAESNGERRWLGRGLGCGAKGIWVPACGAPGSSPATLVRGGSSGDLF